MASEDKNKGSSKVSLADALVKAADKSDPGDYTVRIEVEVGNPKISEYRVILVPGGS